MGVGVALSARHVALCQARRRRGRIEIARAVTAPLPAGALTPAFGAPNLHDPGACEAALAALLAEARLGPAMVAVALPDPAVRVRLLPQEPQGGTRQEKARLVAWQLRDSLPFAPEDARVDYVPLPADGGAAGPTLCLVASDAVVSQYEDLFRRRRLLPIQVGAASLALWHLLEGSPEAPRPGDQLPLSRCVLFVEEAHVTLLAFASGALRFWRCLLDRGAGPVALAHEVGDCLYGLTDDGTLPGPPRVLVHHAGARGAELLDALQKEADHPVEHVAWPEGMPADPAVLPALGAALCG